jgi:transcriptional regulator with XRE-family HTH domain
MKDPINYMEVGLRISTLFAQSNLSQTELGEKLGVKQPQIVRFKNGESLTMDSIRSIAKYFNVSSDWLLFGEEHQGMTDKDLIPISLDFEESVFLSDDVREAFEKAINGDYSAINRIPKNQLILEINNLLQKTKHIRGVNKELTETINNYEKVLRNLKQK